MIDRKAKKFLKEYLSNASPTGYETKGQQIWLDYITPYVDEWHTDVYGTAYAIINPGKKYKVIIEGHADEISWYVNYISDKGFIHVIRNGGSDQTIAASRRVSIHTKNGIVRGVFGWPAIHVRRGKDANLAPTLENIFIDVGAKDKKEVDSMGIHIGCVVTYDDPYEEINKRNFIGRALDNRLGGFCMAEVARKLYEQKINLPYSLYVVNSVQEEVGLRGAQMIVETIRPDVAICCDVTHDTHTPLIDPKQEGDVKLGEGPAVAYAPSVHRKLLELIEEAAKENNIPIQRVASSRSTGTDTDAFAYAIGGIPSALISIPLRYMHTTVEMASFSDVDQLIALMVASLQKSNQVSISNILIDRYLRDIVNLLLYGGAFIGLCAACITAFTFELIGNVEDNLDYIMLVGIATAALYGAHRVIGLHKLAHVTTNDRYSVIRKYKYHIWIYSALWVVLSFWFFIPHASWDFLLWLIPGGSIAITYVVPLFSGGRRLRDIGWIKIIMIGWSWAWLTAFLPAYYFSDQPLHLSILMGIARMLFIIAITIPFEIRDMSIDQSVGLQNMPLRFGLKRSIRWGWYMCIMNVLIAGFLSMHYINGSYVLTMICICILTVWILQKSATIKDDYFFSGVTDGTMILTIVAYHTIQSLT